MIISQVIKKEFYSIQEDATIFQAIDMMARNKDGFVVFTKDDKVTGILTERDLVSYVLKTQDYSQLAFQYANKEVLTFKENRTIEYILMSLIEFEIRRVVIVDKNDKFIGVSTQEYLIRHIDSEAYKVNMQLLHLANMQDLITQDAKASIHDTFECMKENNIGSIVVTQNEQPVGILTERDIIKIIQQETNINNSVLSVMSSPIIYASIDTTVEKTLNIMKQHGIQRVVVKDNEKYKLIGIRDLLHVVKGNYGTLVEKKLKQSKTILNSIQEAIVEVSRIEDEYIVQWCNQKAFDIFGNGIIDNNVNTVINLDLYDKLMNDSINKCTDFEYKIQINDSFYKVNCICDNIDDRDNFRLIFIDITELEELNLHLLEKVDEKTKKLQDINHSLEDKIQEAVEENIQILEKLHKSEKMVAMGEMIGNISHQWRQPLSIISTGATAIQVNKELGLMTDKFLDDTCEMININAQYLSNTIDDFKNFIKGDRKKEIFELNDSINSFLHLMEPTIKSNNISMVLDMQKDIKINGFKNELIQCFINIFNNAKDVMNDIDEDDRLIFISTREEKDNIIINFKDSGCGMDDKILSKVFEPYFTTKHKALGTGLGLHITYQLIVEGMHGDIQVVNSTYEYNSKSYTGAMFTIIMPSIK